MIWSRSVWEGFGLVAGTSATEDVIGLEAGRADESRIRLDVVTAFFLIFFVVTLES